MKKIAYVLLACLMGLAGIVVGAAKGPYGLNKELQDALQERDRILNTLIDELDLIDKGPAMAINSTIQAMEASITNKIEPELIQLIQIKRALEPKRNAYFYKKPTNKLRSLTAVEGKIADLENQILANS